MFPKFVRTLNSFKQQSNLNRYSLMKNVNHSQFQEMKKAGFFEMFPVELVDKSDDSFYMSGGYNLLLKTDSTHEKKWEVFKRHTAVLSRVGQPSVVQLLPAHLAHYCLTNVIFYSNLPNISLKLLKDVSTVYIYKFNTFYTQVEGEGSYHQDKLHYKYCYHIRFKDYQQSFRNFNKNLQNYEIEFGENKVTVGRVVPTCFAKPFSYFPLSSKLVLHNKMSPALLNNDPASSILQDKFNASMPQPLKWLTFDKTRESEYFAKGELAQAATPSHYIEMLNRVHNNYHFAPYTHSHTPNKYAMSENDYEYVEHFSKVLNSGTLATLSKKADVNSTVLIGSPMMSGADFGYNCLVSSHDATKLSFILANQLDKDDKMRYGRRKNTVNDIFSFDMVNVTKTDCIASNEFLLPLYNKHLEDTKKHDMPRKLELMKQYCSPFNIHDSIKYDVIGDVPHYSVFVRDLTSFYGLESLKMLKPRYKVELTMNGKEQHITNQFWSDRCLVADVPIAFFDGSLTEMNSSDNNESKNRGLVEYFNIVKGLCDKFDVEYALSTAVIIDEDGDRKKDANLPRHKRVMFKLLDDNTFLKVLFLNQNEYKKDGADYKLKLSKYNLYDNAIDLEYEVNDEKSGILTCSNCFVLSFKEPLKVGSESKFERMEDVFLSVDCNEVKEFKNGYLVFLSNVDSIKRLLKKNLTLIEQNGEKRLLLVNQFVNQHKKVAFDNLYLVSSFEEYGSAEDMADKFLVWLNSVNRSPVADVFQYAAQGGNTLEKQTKLYVRLGEEDDGKRFEYNSGKLCSRSERRFYITPNRNANVKKVSSLSVNSNVKNQESFFEEKSPAEVEIIKEYQADLEEEKEEKSEEVQAQKSEVRREDKAGFKRAKGEYPSLNFRQKTVMRGDGRVMVAMHPLKVVQRSKFLSKQLKYADSKLPHYSHTETISQLKNIKDAFSD